MNNPQPILPTQQKLPTHHLFYLAESCQTQAAKIVLQQESNTEEFCTKGRGKKSELLTDWSEKSLTEKKEYGLKKNSSLSEKLMKEGKQKSLVHKTPQRNIFCERELLRYTKAPKELWKTTFLQPKQISNSFLAVDKNLSFGRLRIKKKGKEKVKQSEDQSYSKVIELLHERRKKKCSTIGEKIEESKLESRKKISSKKSMNKLLMMNILRKKRQNEKEIKENILNKNKFYLTKSVCFKKYELSSSK